MSRDRLHTSAIWEHTSLETCKIFTIIFQHSEAYLNYILMLDHTHCYVIYFSFKAKFYRLYIFRSIAGGGGGRGYMLVLGCIRQ